jgi:hypothetical protein
VHAVSRANDFIRAAALPVAHVLAAAWQCRVCDGDRADGRAYEDGEDNKSHSAIARASIRGAHAAVVALSVLRSTVYRSHPPAGASQRRAATIRRPSPCIRRRRCSRASWRCISKLIRPDLPAPARTLPDRMPRARRGIVCIFCRCRRGRAHYAGFSTLRCRKLSSRVVAVCRQFRSPPQPAPSLKSRPRRRGRPNSLEAAAHCPEMGSFRRRRKIRLPLRRPPDS